MLKMPVERSAGIIVFYHAPQGRKYLVLRASRDKSTLAKGKEVKEFWDFPKGRLEKGEQGIDAAKRELGEEAGIKKFEIISGFKETVHYFTWHSGKPVPKFIAMFLAETKNAKVKLSWEHDKYEWLSYEDALGRISLKPMKEALKNAEMFLEKHDQ